MNIQLGMAGFGADADPWSPDFEASPKAVVDPPVLNAPPPKMFAFDGPEFEFEGAEVFPPKSPLPPLPAPPKIFPPVPDGVVLVVLPPPNNPPDVPPEDVRFARINK
jgi:hypothetical protein